MGETDTCEKKIERENIVMGVVGVIVLLVLQVILCVWLGVKPHWGPV